MNFKELEYGKCYMVTSSKKIQSVDLFKFKGIDKSLTDSYHIVIDFIRGIGVTENTIDSNKKWGVYDYGDSIKEIDESRIDKGIKHFNMAKATMLAITKTI